MQQLGKEETIRILETATDGMLGLCDNGKPYCIPFGFVWINDTIYLSMFPTGRKWGIIQHNPQVCFSIYSWNTHHTRWSSVIIEGKITAVDDLSEIELMVRANVAKMGLDPEGYLAKRMEYYRANRDNSKGLKSFKIKTAALQARTMATQIGK